MNRRMGVIGASIIALACGACSSGEAQSVAATGTNPTTPPAVVASGADPVPSLDLTAQDVKITKCARDSDGWITVEGIVRNTGTVRRDINLLFEIDAPDGTRLDQVFANVNFLKPGQSAHFSTNTTSVSSKKFTCQLVETE